MPTLGVGGHGRVGCFSLLVVLIVPEETVEHEVMPGGPPFTAAVVKEDETWGGVGTSRP